MNKILLLTFLCCATAISSGGELFPLEKGNWNIYRDSSNGSVKVETIPLKGTNRQVPAVSWEKLESITNKSIQLTVSKSIAKLEEFKQAEFILTLQVEKELPLRRIVMRIRDSKGEIFQLAPTMTGSLKPGKTELHYAFNATDPEKSAESIWSGNGDKKVDWPLQVSGIAIGLNANTPDNERILLDALEVRYQEERCTSISLDTGHPLHLLLPDQNLQPTLVVKNIGDISAELSRSLKITDHLEAVRTEQVSAVVPANGETQITIPGDYTQLGWWMVDYQLKSSSGKEYSGTHRFGRMNPAGSTPGRAEEFLFGLCGHPIGSLRKSPQIFEMEAQAAGICGAKILRTGFAWVHIQPQPDRWDFSLYDRLVDTYGRNGVEIEAILGANLPSWAVPADCKNNPNPSKNSLPDAGDYAKFAGTVAKHYLNLIKYYEIYNEPDLRGFANFPFESYMTLLRSGYDAIKRSAPNAVVMNGGIAGVHSNAGGNPKHNNGWVELLRADGGKHFDRFAFHAHGSFNAYADELRQLNQWELIGPNAPRPWYSNETAATSVKIGEHRQAEILFKKFLYAWSEGAMGYNWYLLREKDNFPIGHSERHFGLITAEFEPKPAYLTYNMLANVYKGSRFRRRVELAPNINACLFENTQGDGLLALWCENASYQLLLAGLSDKTTRIDLFGNEKPITVNQGVAWLNISRNPFTLRIPQIATHDIRNGGSFFATTIPRQLVVPAGGTGELTLPLVNPLSHSVSLEVRTEEPQGLTVSPSHQTVHLNSGRHEIVRIRIVAGSGFNATPTQPAILRYSVTPTGQVADVALLPVVSHISGNDPLFCLNQATQYRTLVETIPENEPLYWSGPRDLSANVYLSRKGEALQLRVIVTDDKHVQPYRGSEVWNGDNVQFTLSLPEQNGFWKFGLTRLADGSSETYCWDTPAGFKADASTIRLETQRNEDKKITVYRAEIPFKAVGLTATTVKTGFRFNLIVNDNDGNRREGFIGIASGLGTNDGEFSTWPTVNLQ